MNFSIKQMYQLLYPKQDSKKLHLLGKRKTYQKKISSNNSLNVNHYKKAFSMFKLFLHHFLNRIVLFV